jgi:hypothetical protein
MEPINNKSKAANEIERFMKPSWFYSNDWDVGRIGFLKVPVPIFSGSQIIRAFIEKSPARFSPNGAFVH